MQIAFLSGIMLISQWVIYWMIWSWHQESPRQVPVIFPMICTLSVFAGMVSFVGILHTLAR